MSSLLKLKIIKSQPDLKLSSRNFSYCTDVNKKNNNEKNLSDKRNVKKMKRFICRNEEKFKDILPSTKSLVFPSTLPTYKNLRISSESKMSNNFIIPKKKRVYAHPSNFNNNNNNNNINGISLPKMIKIPKLTLLKNNNNNYNNITSYNSSNKKENKLPDFKTNTQRNLFKNQSIIKETEIENNINKFYYKIFPKNVKEKPIEKKSLINNVLNFYSAYDNENVETIIRKENAKRMKMNRSAIKLALKNDTSKEKIKILKNKAKFIGNIINYCYPKAFVFKIKQKTEQLKKEKKKLFKNFILPTIEMDLIRKRQNELQTINLINNSFNIINISHSKNK